MVIKFKYILAWLSLLLVLGCKVKEEVQAEKPKPISNFGIIGPMENSRSVTIIDSSKFAVLYELDYGDGFIRKDSLSPDGYGESIGGHLYEQIDRSRVFNISFTVINEKGEKDTKIKQVTIPAMEDHTPTWEDSVQAGYINIPGEIKGLIDDTPVQFISNDSTVFSGSMLFSNSGAYYYSMLFSNGTSRCQVKESFVILLPIFPGQSFYFEKNPPELKYNAIKDSMYVGKTFDFAYTQREGNGQETVYLSRNKAKLLEVKEIDISPDLYLSVFSKGLDVKFELQSDELKTVEGKTIDRKMDIQIKLRLVVDRRSIQPFVNITSIGFCF